MKICYYCGGENKIHDKDCETRFIYVKGRIRIDGVTGHVRSVMNNIKERVERDGVSDVEVIVLDPKGPDR